MNQSDATPKAISTSDGTSAAGATPSSDVTMLPATDVVIVGLGAAGGIASYVLTQAGLNVVGIEAGPRLDKEDFLEHYDELQGFVFGNWSGEPKANHEVPTWRPNAESPAAPPVFATRMANMVGGSSVHYSSQSWRLHEHDFTIRSSTIDRYGDDALPEGSAIADWPVTYDDLEPYYEKVEYLIGVSGKAGENSFESPRSNEYPMPPLQPTGLTQATHDAMAALEYHPFPGPAAITSVEYDGRPVCSYCGYCSAYGCWNDSKSSTLVTAIPDAEATGKLDVRPNCRVFNVLVDEDGKATGVTYRGEDGQMYVQPASVVILSAYTYENVRLLLLSRSEMFPDGLANNHGQVGKYYFTHSYPSVSGFVPGVNLNPLSGAIGQNMSMDDFNADNFDHTGLGFIQGSVIQASMSESTPILRAGAVPPGWPTWGSEYKRWLREDALSIASLGTIFEVLPYEDNYLDLDPEVTDPEGVPVIRITYDIGQDEKARWAFLQERIEEILREMGATETWSAGLAVTPVSTHDMGGARAGDDPETSVVDQHLLTHEIPNLAVMSGANFPSGGGFNPTLTIQAWAWRSSEYIAANFKDIAG